MNDITEPVPTPSSGHWWPHLSSARALAAWWHHYIYMQMLWGDLHVIIWMAPIPCMNNLPSKVSSINRYSIGEEMTLYRKFKTTHHNIYAIVLLMECCIKQNQLCVTILIFARVSFFVHISRILSSYNSFSVGARVRQLKNKYEAYINCLCKSGGRREKGGSNFDTGTAINLVDVSFKRISCKFTMEGR